MFYRVSAKCGHVGKSNYILKDFYQDIPNDYKYGLVYSKFGEGSFDFDTNEEKFMKYCFNQ